MTTSVGFVGFFPSVEEYIFKTLRLSNKIEKAFNLGVGIEAEDANASSYSLERFRTAQSEIAFEEQAPDLVEKAIKFLEKDRGMIFGMFLRQGGHRNSYNLFELNRLYKDLIKQAVIALHKKKPDLIVFRCIPHFVADYLLFRLCEIFHVKAITIETVEPFNAVYFIDSIHEKKPIHKPVNYIKGFEPLLEDFLLEGKKLKGFKPDYYIEVSNERKANASLKGVVKWSVIELGKAIYGCFKNKKSPTAYKSIGKNPSFNTSYYRILKDKAIGRIELFGLRKKLVEYSDDINPSSGERYFLFAANYQPERTTIPDAGNYWDQLEVVEEISACLPEGTVLYFKEHPTIMNFPGKTYYRGFLYRDQEFYSRLASNPKIKIVPIDSSMQELVQHSAGVFTLTGTVAYQSNLAGKPTLIYGSRWFSGCDSLINYESVSQLKGFLATAEDLDDLEVGESWRLHLTQLKDYLMEVPDLLSREGICSASSKEYIKELGEFIRSLSVKNG